LAELKKRARKLRATLVLIDESGMLLAPLVRRTLAPSGQTPVLKQRGRHRDKVSLMAALCLSPQQQRVSLRFRTYCKSYVNNQRAAHFLRQLLRQVRGRVIVVWDQGGCHKGQPIRELLQRHPRLELHALPTYAPELNPVEQLWKHLKYDRFVNQAPDDVQQLHATVRGYLQRLRHKPARLQSLIRACKLPFR
jgi:transposase